MQCSIRNGGAMASAEALSVSEASLQRIKQRGCGTTHSDRSVMRLPDLKAFAYPTSASSTVEATNELHQMYMGRASVQSEGFTPPFADEPHQLGASPVPASLSLRGGLCSNAVHGLDFADTGDIAKLDEVMMGDPRLLYKQIAASIGEAAVPVPQPLAPVDVSDDTRSQQLYGSNKEGPKTFWQSCDIACRGFLYDILHLGEVAKVYRASSSADALRIATVRDGRGPYISLAVLVLALTAAVLWSFWASATAPKYASVVHYPMAYNGPTSLGPFCGLPFRT